MGLLAREEERAIAAKLGNTKSVLCSTVAQLYTAKPASSQWQYTGCWGAVAVVMNREPPAQKLVVLFDLRTSRILMQHEIYEHMDYTVADAIFHHWEVDNGFLGLSFAEPKEAMAFSDKVRAMTPKPAPGESAAGGGKKKGLLGRMFGGGDKKKKQAAIGAPTNFTHVRHVGFGEEGMSFENVPTEWIQFLRAAGVKKRDLKNPEKAKVIMDTMSQFGLTPDSGAPPVAPVRQPPRAPARGGLLDAIKQGAKLRKVEDRPVPEKKTIGAMSAGDQNDLMSTLKAAMAAKFASVNSDDDDDEDDWSE